MGIVLIVVVAIGTAISNRLSGQKGGSGRWLTFG